jgi:hypothetical protein
MRKETKYKVSGVSDIKPTDLPEGLEVKEVEVTAPAATLTIEPIHGSFGSLTITETELHGSREDQAAVTMPGHGIFAEDELRKLRDFLNLVLGEQEKTVRVILDGSGDLWFELKPGLFTYGTYEGSRENPLEKAKDRLRESETDGYFSSFVNRSEDWVKGSYGPIKFLANVKG